MMLMTFSVSITSLITHINNESGVENPNVNLHEIKLQKCMMNEREREKSNGSRKAYRRRYFLLDYNFLSNCASVPMCQHENK